MCKILRYECEEPATGIPQDKRNLPEDKPIFILIAPCICGKKIWAYTQRGGTLSEITEAI